MENKILEYEKKIERKVSDLEKHNAGLREVLINTVQFSTKFLVDSHFTASVFFGKVSQQTRKGSQQTRKVSQQTGKVSQQVGKVSQQTEKVSKQFCQNNKTFSKSIILFSTTFDPGLS